MVLAHGFGGFDEAGPVTYFWGVADALAAEGHEVAISEVDPAAGSDVRGAELRDFVEGVRASTCAARVNLIGHSQGGLDARVVAHEAPEVVAAVVTIATPHHGTSVADVLLGYAPGASEALGNAVFQLFGRVFYGDVDDDPDVRAALELFSQPGITAFNDEYEDGDGVAYFSLTGRTAWSAGLDGCLPGGRPEWVSVWDAELDPRDPLLEVTGDILDFEGTNDGLVTVASAEWGTFLGCVPADHLDEVGQLAGDPPGLGNDFAHLDFYRALADWLVAEGF